MPAISKKDIYLGQERENTQGFKMKIVEYNTYNDIIVEFSEPYKWKTKSDVGHFLRGEIRNRYAPTVAGVGITGNKYPVTDNNGRHTREYQVWSNMIKRCYDPIHRKKNPTYNDVTCDERWFYYDNFYEWMHSQENYEQVSKENKFEVDKDILVLGNRVYSPDTCTLVPARINNLLLKSNKIRGKYPIGVTYRSKNKKYVAACGGKINHHYIGIFSTIEEAFNAYKNYKEDKIKRMATEEYNKGIITKQCYEALMKYEVCIDD